MGCASGRGQREKPIDRKLWETGLAARKNTLGVTKDELQAILLQIAIDAGFPASVECVCIARQVLNERAAKD